MKLTYWHIQHQSDSDCYSIRTRTKREALAFAEEHWNKSDFDPKSVHKVTVEYDSAFDLMDQCLSEGGGYWEYVRQGGQPQRIQE